MSEKKYTEGFFANEIETQYGGLLKASIRTEDFIKFLKENDNNGWVNISIKKKRDKKDSKYSHYGELDVYEKQEPTSQSSTDASDLPI